jgi:hypothetical protein
MPATKNGCWCDSCGAAISVAYAQNGPKYEVLCFWCVEVQRLIKEAATK